MNIDHDIQIKMINSHKDFLGNRNTERLLYLAAIQSNWDGQNGSPMNTQSLSDMIIFLINTKDKLPEDLGIFFDYEGYVSINWKVNNEIVDINFQPDGAYLFVHGFDDGLILPSKLHTSFKFMYPKKASEAYQARLLIVSPILEKLSKTVCKMLLDIVMRDNGWGEHGDEKTVDLNSLDSFVQFFTSMTDIPDNLVLFQMENGNIEVMWRLNKETWHDLEFTPEGMEFFESPEFIQTITNKKDFKQYNSLNDFLKGATK